MEQRISEYAAVEVKKKKEAWALGRGSRGEKMPNTTDYFRNTPKIEVIGGGGKLSREEMREAYASSNVFVLPTRGEGWGLPAVEVSVPTAFLNTRCVAIPFFSHAA